MKGVLPWRFVRLVVQVQEIFVLPNSAIYFQKALGSTPTLAIIYTLPRIEHLLVN
jgi:hypothetical protein